MLTTKHFVHMLSTASLLFLATIADAAYFFPSGRLTSGLITCLCQDSLGYVWIGTEYGLNKFDGYRFTNYFHHEGDSTSLPNNEIATFHVDDEGTLWVGCSRGLARYDRQTDSFHNYHFPDGNQPRVISLLTDADRRLLVGTAGYGLYSLRRGSDNVHFEDAMNRRPEDMFYSRMFMDREGALWRSSHQNKLTRFLLPSATPVDYAVSLGQPMSFLDYSADALLVVCQYGLLRFDYNTAQFTDAGFDLTALGPQPSIISAMTARDGSIYIATSRDGLFVVHRGEHSLLPVDQMAAPALQQNFSLRQANVPCVMEDRYQNLWVGCYNRGLLLMGRGREAFSAWTNAALPGMEAGVTSSVVADGSGDGIYCVSRPGGVSHFDSRGIVSRLPAVPEGTRLLFRDGEGHYWLATESTLYSYDPESGHTQPRRSFSGRGITSIADDGKGTLFVGGLGCGLAVLDTHTGLWDTYTMADTARRVGYLCNDWVKQLFVDSRGMLWICTAGGLCAMEPEGRVFNSRQWNVLLAGVHCYCACEVAGGILVATESGLFRYDHSSNSIALLPDADLLQDKMICAMTTDRQGTVWMSSNAGIWQLQPNGHIIAHISGNGLSGREYVPGVCLNTLREDGAGRIFFGTPSGITSFRPADVMMGADHPGRVFLTRLLVNGHSWPVPDVQEGELPSLALSNKENSLQLEFSLLDFHDADNISFQWRMEGTREWNSLAEGNNQLMLNELQPGSYAIEVRAANNGRYSAEPLRLPFTIAKPWYRSWWAYLFYLLVTALIAGLVLYNYIRQQRRNLEETKMRFLINATHDIRSPLTLIMGAVDKMKGQSGSMNDAVDTISRNAQRLLQLVNQILDERKLDKGQLRLHCRETELNTFVGAIVSLYEFGASQRNITLGYHHPETAVKAWVDRTQFDKVVSNLLSNALKYTPDGGSVSVDLDLSLGKDSPTVVLTVTDSGLGFSDDDTEKFFKRFYQGKNSRDLHIDGTGIGLNLSRAITEMHGGRVTATNRHDGQTGAILSVSLPMGNSHLKPEQIEKEEQAISTKDSAQKMVTGNGRILIVDDDAEIVHFIESELSQWYRFETAANGREGLKMILTRDYDLIISDVMMPEMDGMTMLKSVKQNPQVSHLPVILLTSKAEVEYRMEGLRKGADAYLAKPFRMEELHVLIDNLLNNVRRMRGKFSGALQQQERVEKVEVKGNNDALMERIMKVVNANLSNADFTVDMLTKEVGLSRAQLHRKMKEITGVSTTEFIRNLRMEQAARLIKEKKLNVTQVAYSVGFNNQTHFSTVFKKYFGQTPTEFSNS